MLNSYYAIRQGTDTLMEYFDYALTVEQNRISHEATDWWKHRVLEDFRAMVEELNEMYPFEDEEYLLIEIENQVRMLKPQYVSDYSQRHLLIPQKQGIMDAYRIMDQMMQDSGIGITPEGRKTSQNIRDSIRREAAKS